MPVFPHLCTSYWKQYTHSINNFYFPFPIVGGIVMPIIETVSCFCILFQWSCGSGVSRVKRWSFLEITAALTRQCPCHGCRRRQKWLVKSQKTGATHRCSYVGISRINLELESSCNTAHHCKELKFVWHLFIVSSDVLVFLCADHSSNKSVKLLMVPCLTCDSIYSIWCDHYSRYSDWQAILIVS